MLLHLIQLPEAFTQLRITSRRGSFWLLALADVTDAAAATDAATATATAAAPDAVFILCEGTCCNYQDQDK